MRCAEMTGFLLLHRCREAAVHECAFCGKNICQEHAAPVTIQQVDTAGQPVNARSGVACHACLRARRQQFNDPYYNFPYFGSYLPYDYTDYTLDDRQAFNQPYDPTLGPPPDGMGPDGMPPDADLS